MSPRTIRLVNLGLLICIGLLIAIGLSVFHKEKNDSASLACTTCNVILISIDTLGADHTSLYNRSLTATPFLSSLAKKDGAIIFDNAYAQASWTLPSHTAMLTGSYPWQLDVWKPNNILPKNAPYLPETLKAYGYETVAFSNGAFVRPRWYFDRGFDAFYGTTTEDGWEDLPSQFENASSWLQQRAKDKPFFMLLRPFEVHDPFITNDGTQSFDIKDIIRINLQEGGATTIDAVHMRDAYHKEVRVADHALEYLFSELQRLGLNQSTIVVITSDHGEEFNEHGLAGVHGHTLYRELLHVPLIILTPKNTPPRRISESIEIRSIPATIAHIIGTDKTVFDGTSLVPLILGTETADRTVLSATSGIPEMLREEAAKGLDRSITYKTVEQGVGTTNLPFNGKFQASAIRGRWHAIKKPDDSIEVYDMTVDPKEQRNLAFELWSLSTEDQQTVNDLIQRLGTVR